MRFRSTRRQGYVLVTSLLVLVLLTGLGTGAFFLTNMNLRISENTRTSAIAQYHANEGLDVALLVLAREYYQREDGTWPSLTALQARIPDDSPYEVVSMDMDSADAEGYVRGGVVTVRGLGPRDAAYETGARFEGKLSPIDVPGPADPIFGTGWVTNSSILINGNTQFRIPLWAGADINANATRVLPGAGMFAFAGTDECKIFTGGGPNADWVPCNGNEEPPSVPDFSFVEARDSLISERPDSECTNVTSDQTINASTLGDNATLCLDPDVTVTISGTARGLYVIGDETTTVNFGAETQPVAGDEDETGVKIASGTIVPTSGLDLNGNNTLYAVNDLEFRSSGTAVTGTGSDEDLMVGTLLATEGSVTFGGDTKGSLESVIWANGHVCKYGGGGLNFTGTMLVGADGSVPTDGPCTSGIYWNGGGGGSFAGISNQDIPDEDGGEGAGYEASGLSIVARQP